MRRLAQTLRALSQDELLQLKAVERGMRSWEFVPLEEISASTRIDPARAEYLLGRLEQQRLVDRSSVPSGYRIGFSAYDLLALNDLAQKEVVASLGEVVGVGKESVVYEALSGEGEPLIIKFHREGLTSFHHVRRVRAHLRNRPRHPWIQAARLGARREYLALKRLYPKVAVPRPRGWSRHAIVMDLVHGVPLRRARLENPEEVLEDVLVQVSRALEIGLIHADLSEYNVLVGDGITIIDWPQAISTRHPAAQEALKKDIANILHTFQRRYLLEMSLSQALERLGWSQGV